jgi:protein-L-isoaspartate(D-aspartate) O-methyltransferase
MNQPEDDFLRKQMVERQLRARGISDQRLLRVMERVPRHLFVPENQKASAYEDTPLPIGYGQTISQPYMVAVMTEALELTGSERVLEIGTGSGYQAAVLSELAREVISIERIEPLAAEAAQRLARLGYLNVQVVVDDGSKGFAPRAPYEGILVTAGAPAAPEPLLEQLAVGGRMVVPVGDRLSQELEVHTRLQDDKFEVQRFCPCRFVDLIGKYGWKE